MIGAIQQIMFLEMPPMKLTDIQCKNAKPKDKPYKLAAGRDLYLEVMPTGSKYWRMKYRFMGKETRLTSPA